MENTRPRNPGSPTTPGSPAVPKGGASPGRTDYFALCRNLSARQVLMNFGIPAVRKGGRWWACCPLHGEKQPSLLLDAQGRFYCFGCGAHGDAVALYAALRRMQPYAAARELWLQLGDGR